MAVQDEVLQVYRDLANWYERHDQPQMRDRFLVLAADAAKSAGHDQEAERQRQRLLALNPQHLLRPYNSMAQALQAPDVQIYIRDLRLNYPLETARELLNNIRASEEESAIDGPSSEFNLSVDDATWHTAPGADPLEQTAALPPIVPRPRTATNQPGRTGGIGDPVPPRSRQTEAEANRPARPAPSPRRAAESDIDQTARPSSPAGRARPSEINETAALPVRSRTPAPSPQPAPRSTSLPRPAAQPAPQPIPARSQSSMRSETSPKAAPPAEPMDSGGWLSVLLFVVVLLGGIATAVWTLGRPFLPMP
jgi:hypothetical protein